MPLDPINWPLVYHNTVSVVFLVTSAWLAFFVLLKNPTRTVNLTFFGLTCSSAIVYVSHLVGVNTTNILIADAALQWNLIIVPLVAFNNHLVFAVLGKEHEQRYWIISVYVIAAAMTAFFALYPRLFFEWPVPKMYFNFYYVPGDYYWVMRVFQNIVPTYFIYHLIRAYLKATGILRARLKYFLLGLGYGYGVSTLILPLMYDIEINPIYAMTFGFYTVIFAYAILQYELLEIRVLARRALFFSFLVVAVGFLIIGANFGSNLALARIDGFPPWAIPLVSGVIAVLLGYMVWRRTRESDILKYEFINVVTHKFRTPLTHIKWAAETIQEATDLSAAKGLGASMGEAGERLVGLTDVLLETTAAESRMYRYQFEPLSLSQLVREIEEPYLKRAREKNVRYENAIPEDVPKVFADAKRIASVLQVLLENALTYTPQGGSVSVLARVSRAHVTVSVTDTGVGIAKEDIPRVFSKFFRTSQAKLADTEGVGIRLYIARQILLRHRGSIWVESEGVGRGATFFMRLARA